MQQQEKKYRLFSKMFDDPLFTHQWYIVSIILCLCNRATCCPVWKQLPMALSNFGCPQNFFNLVIPLTYYIYSWSIYTALSGKLLIIPEKRQTEIFNPIVPKVYRAYTMLCADWLISMTCCFCLELIG